MVAKLDYAHFWVRLGALFIDLVILLATVLALAFWSNAVGIAGSDTASNFTVGFLILASPWLYFWLFTGSRGQTLGKMAVGIHVVNAQGKVPGLGRAALREIMGKTISTLALFLGFLWIIWDPRKQGWHDMMASTYVVRRRRL